MKKVIVTLTSVLVLTGLLCSCGSYEPIVEPTSDTTASEATSEETTEATTETTKEEVVYDYESEIPTDYTMSFKGGESGTVEKITTAKAVRRVHSCIFLQATILKASTT